MSNDHRPNQTNDDACEQANKRPMQLQQNELSKILNTIAQDLLACPIDDNHEAVHATLSSTITAMGALAGAVYFQEQSEELDKAEYFWSTTQLNTTHIKLLTSAHTNALKSQLSGDYWHFSEVGIDSKTGFGTDAGIILPLPTGGQVDACIILAFDKKVEENLPHYSDFLHVLANMLAYSMCRCSEAKLLTLLKERLREGQAYANLGTFEWDLSSGSLFCSERIAPLFGLPPGQSMLSREYLTDAVHANDRDTLMRVVTDAASSGAPYDLEWRVLWPDGSSRWVRGRGGVTRNSTSSSQKMLGTIQDINDQKLAQLSLEEREQELRQVQELAKLGRWYIDMNSDNIIATEETYQIYGLRPGKDTFTLQQITAAVHPADRHMIDKARQHFEQAGRYEMIHRIVRPDGKIRNVVTMGFASKFSENTPTAITCTVQDITHHVQLEEHLRESEQRFAFAVEGAGDAIWDWNIVTNEIEYSGLSENFLGYDSNELPSQIDILSALLHDEDRERLEKSHGQCVRGETESYKEELRMRCKDGSYKWILCRASVVSRDDNGKAVRIIGIHSDISDSKANEAELIAARDEAERANLAKSDFLSHMSHELRTPMNAILGFSQLLEQDHSLSADNADKVAEISKAGAHLLRLINEMLDLAKVEAGKIELSLEAVPVTDLLVDVARLLNPLAANNGIKISTDEIDAIAVASDKMRLKQVLINLLSNSIKYNRDGGHVTISASCINTNTVRIAIKDTGIGIAPPALNEIFHPFNRHRANDTEVEGAGIGLTLTKALVELMNGSIGVESTVGEGSCFWVDLPIAQITDQVTTPQLTTNDYPTNQNKAEHKTVLYIDDNPVNLKLVKHILATVPNISLVEALSGEAGINIAEAIQPDLLLVDINMPGIDGYEVLHILKNKPAFADKHFVAVTANAMAADVAKGKAAGFSEYLSKPFNISEFKSVLCRLLA